MKTIIYNFLFVFFTSCLLLSSFGLSAQYDNYQNRGLANNNFNRDVPVVIPIYEYVADKPLRYFYASQPDIGSGWQQNGIAFNAYQYQEQGTVRIYRYFGKNPWRFAYSTDPNLNTASGKWTQEGVAFYAYLSPTTGAIPIYQHSIQYPLRFQYSAQNSLGNGWQNDGIAFYAMPASGSTINTNESFNPLADYSNQGTRINTSNNNSGNVYNDNYNNNTYNNNTYNNSTDDLRDRGAYTTNFDNYADYVINIKTGNAVGAETNAQVEIGLVNERGETTWINANDRIGFTAFRQNSMDTFVLPNSIFIGNIVEIKVRLNKNSGFEDDWLLEYIQVQRGNGQTTTANFNQWVR